MKQNWDFFLHCVDNVKAEYFEDKVLIWFFQTMINYYQDYNTKPTDVVIANELRKCVASGRIKEDEISSYTEVFKELKKDVFEQEYLWNEVVRFCKAQATRKAMMESASLINSEDPEVWDRIVQMMAEATSVGNDAGDLGIQYFKDYKDRVLERARGDDRLIIPTGVSDLDSYIGGGPKSGQMMMWMAGTGVGKSIALVNVGRRAVTSAYNVVHYTLELSQKEIADRYDSCWTKFPIAELIPNTAGIVKKLGELGDKYGNSLIIKSYPTKGASVHTLRSHLMRIVNNEFKPDMIIVDYLDLLKHTSSYNDEYSDLGETAAYLRGLVGEGGGFFVPLHTATQVNRAGAAAHTPDVMHVSDSFKKMFIADIVAVICMTREERNANIARIALPKNRNGPADIEITIPTAYHRMCFYNPQGSIPLIGDAAKVTVTKKEPEKPLGPPKLPKAIVVSEKPKRDLQTIKFPLGPLKKK